MGKDVQPLQSVKTGILVVLTVKSDLGGSCCDDDELVKLLCSFDYRLCYENNYAYTWSCDKWTIYATLTFAI